MDRMESDSEKIKKAALTEIDDFCMMFGINAEGYTESEVAMNRKKYGANDLVGKNRKQYYTA